MATPQYGQAGIKNIFYHESTNIPQYDLPELPQYDLLELRGRPP